MRSCSRCLLAADIYAGATGPPGCFSEGFSLRRLQRGLKCAGYQINGGLRRMSDLETPAADMRRDQSSLDVAPATLRPEESRPGLDPDNPGAAPDTTLGHQRHVFARLRSSPC
jgi:hypothetical protein